MLQHTLELCVYLRITDVGAVTDRPLAIDNRPCNISPDNCNTLSVTCGDSSPIGRAKIEVWIKTERIGSDTLR